MNLYMVLPFVVAIIQNKDGKILIGRHPNLARKPYPLFWDLPGGKLEEGESPEECIVREIKEETGFAVTSLKYLGIFHHSKNKILSVCTNRTPSLGLCYVAKVKGELVSTEMSNLHWATKDEIKKLKLTPWTKEFMKIFCS